MNPAIDKLLSQVYELEGLLLVLDRHNGDVSPFVYEMIQKKVERINELAPTCCPEIFERKPNIPVSEPEEQETEDDEFTTEDGGDIAEDEEPVEPEPSEPEPLEEDEPEEENIFDEDMPVFDEDIPVEDEDTEEPLSDEEEQDEPITLDEALQRAMSKDLSRAFTWNDRFRYRRELFANSEVEMRNTIDMVEAMHSFSEAEDYFYGDLEWDRESPEVKDFMTIIRNHFL